jgi:hypothetical protein
MTTIYRKSDFDRIQYDGFSYTLDPDVVKIIQGLADQVGAPEYIKTPQFEKRANLPPQHMQQHQHQHTPQIIKYKTSSNDKKRFNIKGGGQEITDEDWESIRKFQATVLAKKEGIEASIDQIRKHLNKLTDKTYDKLKLQIIDEINKIILTESASMSESAIMSESVSNAPTEYTPELLTELKGVGDAIFNIASSNGFFSKIYATLYKELMAQFSFMRGIFDTNYKAFNSIFKTIEYCDPNKDYDKFCQNNKNNEKRRSMCLFYINLMLQGIIAPKSILKITTGLQELLLEKIKIEDAKNIVDELAEVLYTLIKHSAHVFKNGSNIDDQSSDDDTTESANAHASIAGANIVGASSIAGANSIACAKSSLKKWESVVSNVKYIAQLKQNAFPSISNKTIFKHMDMIDEAKL